MAHISRKIGELVEIRRLTDVGEPYSAPEAAIAGYHFTDITSDLMTQWIGSAGSVHVGQGRALALAGCRGAGKSHFLAVLAGLLSSPELRSKVADNHVRTGAESLGRRKWPVAVVKRGSTSGLGIELRDAIAAMVGSPAESLPEDVGTLLLRTYEACNNEPFAIFIDTDGERETAVTRQDGPVLTQIAEAAKAIGIFVAVALDDDIAGADGSNVSIVGNYGIDYLEQEHLFKIIDTNLFIKKKGSTAVIQSAYKQIQASSRRFKWSEQKFAQLYPLHPAVAEAAAFVRIYVRKFALLKFAFEAGDKAKNSSASDLVRPDAVFDSIEEDARQVGELKEAFKAYDKLAKGIRAGSAFDHRVLKGLFVLSLEGRSVAVDDIAAALLLTEKETNDLSEMLARWAESTEGYVKREDVGTGSLRYRLDAGDGANQVEIDGIENVTDEDIWMMLVQHAAEKFSDLRMFDQLPSSIPSAIEWRGGIRRGAVYWHEDASGESPIDRHADWRVVVRHATQAPAASASVEWRVADLTPAERNSIARLHRIQTDPGVREQLGEKVAVERHRLSLALDSAWQRTFLTEGLFVSGKIENKLPATLLEAHNLAQLLSIGLAPILDERFPDHPLFPMVLHQKETAMLISRFFAGTGDGAEDREVQRAAKAFVVPLGLAAEADGRAVPLALDQLRLAAAVQVTGVSAQKEKDEPITLEEISRRFADSTLGLPVDAQRLVLTALVSQRLIDLVTSEGNRINYRSLDLQIIWDDVVGIALSLANEYSESKLNAWSRALFGDDLQNVRADKGIEALESMLSNWGAGALLELFHSTPEDAFNASVWRRVAAVEKKFEVARLMVSETAAGRHGVEDCLGSIIGLFSDIPGNYDRFVAEVEALKTRVAADGKRYSMVNSMHFFEPTDDAILEEHRCRLLDLIGRRTRAGDSEALDSEWNSLRLAYGMHYAGMHSDIKERMPDAPNICDGPISEMRLDGTFCDCQTSLAQLRRMLAVDSTIGDAL